MGKKNGSSWLSAVKRAFRSPSKKERNDPHCKEIEEDEEKVCCFSRSCYSFQEREMFFCSSHFLFLLQKKEKRRWLFKKPATQDSPVKPSGVSPPPPPQESDNANSKTLPETAPSTATPTPVPNAGRSPSAVATSASPIAVPNATRRIYYARENYAVVVIQTSFRGYLVSYKQLTKN